MEDLKTIDEFITYVRTKLGEPKIRVELANSQISQNLFDAIQLFREYARENGNFQAYMVLDLQVGKNTYTLPDNILQIGGMKKSLTASASAFVLASLSGMAASDMLSLKNFDMVSYTMLTQWIHYLDLVTSSPYKLFFNNNTKVLTLIPTPNKADRLMIEVFKQATTDELLNERFIKDYTLALCKITWGGILGKFQSIPGYGGAVSLNGGEIRQEGLTEKKELEDDLINSFKWSRPPMPLFHSK